MKPRIKQAIEISQMTAENIPLIGKRRRLSAICLNKKGEVVSIGVNNYTKSHPTQYTYASKCNMPDRIYLHAEVSAIIKAKSKDIHTIIVTHIGVDGNLLNAKPCPICQMAIEAAGIKNVIFSTNEGYESY
jgi:deoxycytidylate deaminase